MSFYIALIVLLRSKRNRLNVRSCLTVEKAHRTSKAGRWARVDYTLREREREREGGGGAEREKRDRERKFERGKMEREKGRDVLRGGG